MLKVNFLRSLFASVSKASNPKPFELFSHENYSFRPLTQNHKK